MTDADAALKTSRRHRAFEMRLAGEDFRAIGAALGVSHVTAYKWVRREIERLNATLDDQVDEYRRVQYERCEQLVKALWPQCTSEVNSYRARNIEVLLKVLERQSKLYGLDAPLKTDVRLGVVNLSDAELLAEAERVGIEAAINAALPGESDEARQRLRITASDARPATASAANGDGALGDGIQGAGGHSAVVVGIDGAPAVDRGRDRSGDAVGGTASSGDPGGAVEDAAVGDGVDGDEEAAPNGRLDENAGGAMFPAPPGDRSTADPPDGNDGGGGTDGEGDER